MASLKSIEGREGLHQTSLYWRRARFLDDFLALVVVRRARLICCVRGPSRLQFVVSWGASICITIALHLQGDSD